MIALTDMRQGVSGHRVRQLGGSGNQPFKPLPSTPQLRRLIQGRAITSGVEQGGTKGFEGAQGVLHRRFSVSDLGIAELFGTLPCLADDPIVGLDHRVRKRRTPRDHADRDDGQAAITADVAQAISEIAFTLTLQATHPMGWNAPENIRRQVHLLQEFQPVEQAGGISRVLPHLELAQPDEPADLALDHFRKQAIEAGFQGIIQSVHDGAIDLAFRRDKRIRTEALDDGYTLKDGPGPAALIDKPAGQIMVGGRVLRLTRKPSLQLTCAVTGKHLETVELAEVVKMLLTGLTPSGVGKDLIPGHAQLGPNKPDDGLRDHLARR